MGFLDDMAGGPSQHMPGAGAQQGMLEGIPGMLTQQPGRRAGLVQRFHARRLGDLVLSWIGTGRNKPVSAAQVRNALGNDQIQQPAGKLGTTGKQAAGGLAQLVPQVVDRQACASGQLPNEDALPRGFDVLKGKLFGG